MWWKPPFQVTHSTWPSGHLKSFYRKIIANRPYATHYRALVDDSDTNFTDLGQLKAERLVRQHFLKLQLLMDRNTIMEYTDQPQLSFIGYLSQLGGALNFWAGITVVVVIEMVEVLFELVGGKVGLWREDQRRGIEWWIWIIEETQTSEKQVTTGCKLWWHVLSCMIYDCYHIHLFVIIFRSLCVCFKAYYVYTCWFYKHNELP